MNPIRVHSPLRHARGWRAAWVLRSLNYALVLLPVAARAQQVDGGLEGRVLDASGVAVNEAHIVVEGPQLLGRRDALTGRDGNFRVVSLPVGRYSVRVAHLAYQTVTLERVTIELGATTSLGELRLEAKVVELPKVIVSSRRPAIDPTTTTMGTTLSAETFQALPTDRRFRSIVALAPQANPSFTSEDVNIAGMTGEGNYYFIDGVDVTDPAMGGTSINLPYDFVQAIEVKTGGYEAEYGRALGGIVNLVTPSGSNEYQRQMFGYYTDHRMVGRPANSLFEGTAGDFSAYDFGGSLGGPLVADRLWWFGAYNPTSDTRDAIVPGLSTHQSWGRAQRFAGKLAWRASDRTRVNLTVLGDPESRRIVGAPFGMSGPPAMVLNEDAVVAETRDGGAVVALNATHQLRSNVILKAALSSLDKRAWITPQSAKGNDEPYFIDLETGTASGGYGAAQKNRQQRLAGKLGATMFVGRHTWKSGFEYQDNAITNDTEAGAGKAHGGWIYRSNDSTYQWFQAYGVGTVHLRLPTAFLQDAWRLTDRVRVNAGLRWDGNYLVDRFGKTALRVTDGWQPRLGLVYSPGAPNTHKFSGSYGRYFEQLPTQSPGYYFFDSKQLYMSFNHDPRVNPTGGDTLAIQGVPPGSTTAHGEYYDEYSLGYERALQGSMKLGVRGTLRNMGQVVEDAYNAALNTFVIGNPGEGALTAFPRATHRYSALEFTLARTGERAEWAASYVLSRNFGNYAGIVSGNAGPQFDFVETTTNATGYLPNDRRHVVKLQSVFRARYGVTLGNTVTWASGAPISELGAIPGLSYTRFLSPRGSAGRTPSLWDWSMRVAHSVGPEAERVHAKLTLDLFHLLSPRRAILVDQQHYYSVDNLGQQTNENPAYQSPTLYQPAFNARFGATFAF